jgi:hypothetical protein
MSQNTPNAIPSSQPRTKPVPNCECECAPPQPWTCNPNDLNATTYMSPFGCKKPQEVYDQTSHQCCVCSCDPNESPAARVLQK